MLLIYVIFSVLVLCTQVNIKFVMLLGIESQNMTYSNRPDHIAQLAEHWASIPQVVGLISTVARHIFSGLPSVDIQSE